MMKSKQCAWAATRKKESYLRHRHGPKKAICAVAASILTAVYHMLRDGTFFQDLGEDYMHSGVRFAAVMAVRLGCFALAAAGIVATLRIAFSGG